MRLTIEPHETNRVVEVVAESSEFFRSSEIALEGERGPRTVFMEFRNLPGGSYDVRVVVTDNKGQETMSERRLVEVIDTGR